MSGKAVDAKNFKCGLMFVLQDVYVACTRPSRVFICTCFFNAGFKSRLPDLIC